MDKIKGVLTGKPSPEASQSAPGPAPDSFTLIHFADTLKKAKRAGTLMKYVVGKNSEATSADAIKQQEGIINKHEGIIRFLGGLDPTGENLQTSHKQEAAKNCGCSITDVDNALVTFTLAKNAQKKLEQLKEEKKPMPKSMDEMKKLMGLTQPTTDSFTLLQFADSMKYARRAGTLKEYVAGRSSEVTLVEVMKKQEEIIRFLGGLDPTGENLQASQKQEAAKHCSCTIADVENVLAKFVWAKQAEKKVKKLKEENKPIPTTMAEMQKLMGSTPMDLARSNLAKSGQLSRNAMCPCGSKKKYKRCCGKDRRA